MKISEHVLAWTMLCSNGIVIQCPCARFQLHGITPFRETNPPAGRFGWQGRKRCSLFSYICVRQPFRMIFATEPVVSKPMFLNMRPCLTKSPGWIPSFGHYGHTLRKHPNILGKTQPTYQINHNQSFLCATTIFDQHQTAQQHAIINSSAHNVQTCELEFGHQTNTQNPQCISQTLDWRVNTRETGDTNNEHVSVCNGVCGSVTVCFWKPT